MYTILITDSNELITSQRERIMQRSKLVDTLHFLTDPVYKELDMSSFTVLMEYVLPVSREYHSEILTKSEELYKGKLEYKVPVDTGLTREAGDVEIQITFLKAEMDADGNTIQRVRKTSPTAFTVIPISAWSNQVADSDLTAVDQRLIQTNIMLEQVESMIQALENMSQQLMNDYSKKADDLSYENGKLQLTANGVKIGTAADVASGSICECEDDGSIKLIEF